MDCAKFPPISATLAPLSVQTLTLICIPLGDGDLVIKGCNIRLAGCAERACLLPLNAPTRGEDILRAFAFDIMQQKKAKHATYERWCQTRKDLLEAYANEDDCTFLTCRVIPKQPLLVERGVSLTHGIAMLYEGERYGSPLTHD